MAADKDMMQKLKEAVGSSRAPLIICHVNPDGDTIGTALAFSHVFRAMGKTPRILSPGPFPSFLSWMPSADQIFVHKNEQPAETEALFQSSDLILCLDFNAPARAGSLSALLLNSKTPKVLLDHHPDPEPFADIVISDVRASSTAEIAYIVITQLTESAVPAADVAACLYCGIMTDTGCYSYSCTAETHRITGKLLEAGIDAARIHQQVYDTYSEKRMRLLGFCLSQRMVVNEETHSAYIYLSQADRDQFNYQTGDSEGLVNYGLSIGNVVFAAIIIERENEIKLSFRSKGGFNVNEFARKYFQGGGHRNAAGASSFVSLKETIRLLEVAINENQSSLIHQYQKLYS